MLQGAYATRVRARDSEGLQKVTTRLPRTEAPPEGVWMCGLSVHSAWDMTLVLKDPLRMLATPKVGGSEQEWRHENDSHRLHHPDVLADPM